MELSDLIKLRQSLLESLEIVESDIDKLRNDSGVKKHRVQFYVDNSFIQVDKRILAMAYILSEPGISVDDLCSKLGVARRTLYYWDEIAKVLRARERDSL